MAGRQEQVALFGPFRFHPGQRTLYANDRPVRLGGRAVDLLAVLIERAGDLISKDELIKAVWPDVFVDEVNLRVHIGALRRALGEGNGGEPYLVTTPGRGYCFAVHVNYKPVSDEALPDISPAKNRLPSSIGKIVGRGDLIESIVAQMPARRFISLIGPGGIGKTTVAVAAAEHLVSEQGCDVRFLDLAALNDSALLSSTLASAFDRPALSDNPIPGLVNFLRDKSVLIILDSCDRVIQHAASIAEQIVGPCPGVWLLATSREPLRAEGERVVRLGPLQYPADTTMALTAAAALQYSAIELLVERASANNDLFELSDADAPIAAEICRRLDGIALAIELAASRIDLFGLGGLAARLDDRFRLLTNGRRTALPRQQTLRATFDWSYDFLPEAERTFLRALTAFVGPFTWEAARAVVDFIADDENFEQALANLLSKSLVAADLSGAQVLYRLLDTTRAYAAQKIASEEETQILARRHAEYFLSLFTRAAEESWSRVIGDWLADYRHQLENLRRALDWAFSKKGDSQIGVKLTAAAIPLWMQLSLVEECRSKVERALGALDSLLLRGGMEEMKLQAGMGSALLHQKGSGQDIVVAWSRCVELAEIVGDLSFKLSALWGLYADQYYGGDLRAALRIVERYRAAAAASPDPVDVLVGERIYGLALHCVGDQTQARLHLENVLRDYRRPPNRSDIVRFQYDQRISAAGTLALVLWLQGHQEEAMKRVRTIVQEAFDLDHALSICSALANTACPIALSNGELDEAEHYIRTLLLLTQRNGIVVFNAWARAFEGLLKMRRGAFEKGLHSLKSAFDDFPYSGFALRYSAFRTELAESMGLAGEVDAGLREITSALERSERNNERWCWSEMMRVKGDLLLIEGADDCERAAEDSFEKALQFAEEKGTLTWSLRTTASLARLRARQGRRADALSMLSAVLERFTDIQTDDIGGARRLAAELRKSTGDVDSTVGAPQLSPGPVGLASQRG